MRKPPSKGPPLLLRRPPEGPAPRAGRASRSRRCGVRARRPGRSPPDRPPRQTPGQNASHTDDGRACSPATKRATNILQIEERGTAANITASRIRTSTCNRRARDCGRDQRHQARGRGRGSPREDFAAAMQAISTLRPYVDAFFDKVSHRQHADPTGARSAQAPERDPRGDARSPTSPASRVGPVTLPQLLSHPLSPCGRGRLGAVGRETGRGFLTCERPCPLRVCRFCSERATEPRRRWRSRSIHGTLPPLRPFPHVIRPRRPP